MAKIDELLEQVRDDKLREEQDQGARLTFFGKSMARRLWRRVQPRTSRRLAKYSVGPEEEQARNQVIEGENLQAMVTLYRERGQVDLILTDPRTTLERTSGTTIAGTRTRMIPVSGISSRRTTLQSIRSG
jgi:hypothetical protein